MMNEGMYGAKEGKWQLPLCDREERQEISGDYVLPDYLPEIRKILQLSVTALPPAKYVGSDTIEWNGTAEYSLLYVGADGRLYSAPLDGEYAFTIPLEGRSEFDLGEGVVSFCSVSCEGASWRVLAPRKCNVRAKLLGKLQVYGMCSFEERMEGEVNPLTLERCDGSVCGTSVFGETGELLSLSGELSDTREDLRIVSGRGSVYPQSVEPRNGSVLCDGQVKVDLLVDCDGEIGHTETLSLMIPFHQEIECEESVQDSKCTAHGSVARLNLSYEEGRILCEAEILLSIRGQKEQRISCVSDLYSTERASAGEYRTYEIPTALASKQGNFTQSNRFSCEETGIPADGKILDVICEAIPRSMGREKNKLWLAGDCRYMILCEKDGEYSSYEVNVPFRYECDGEEGEPRSLMARVMPMACRGRIEQGTVQLDSELCVCCNFLGQIPLRALSTVTFGDRFPARARELVIAYPAKGENDWEIAKRYAVPLSAVEAPQGKSFRMIKL